MERLAAGIDLGTSRIKLHVYDEEGRIVYSESRPSPLHWHRGKAWHDPQALRQALLEMRKRALEKGAKTIGIALYRASVTAWKPGGETLEPVILWLDRQIHEEAYRRLPLRARVASKIPPYNKVINKHTPLPVIHHLHARHPEARVWTLDALVSEWIGAGYRAEPTAAALTGIINPRSLKPIPLIRELAGLRDLQLPLLGDNILDDEPMNIRAIISDQQAALLALPCDTSCVKLSLGTGFFADRRIQGPPPLTLPRGQLPIVLYKHGKKVEWGIETLAPGAGLAVQGLAEAIGGFQTLHQLKPKHCKQWQGSILLPYPAGPGAGVGASRVVLLGNPSIMGDKELACTIIMSIVSVASYLVWLHRERPGKVYLTGSIVGIPIVRGLLQRVMPGEVYYCLQDSTPLGAAMLALNTRGESLPMECDRVGSGEGLYNEVSSVFHRLLLGPDAGERAQEVSAALINLVENN